MSQPIPIHYYIHGRGRGHASRSLPIVDALRQDGHHVTVFAGEDARALFDGDANSDIVPVTSIPTHFGPSVVALIGRRVQAARRAIRHQRPHLVISDGDLPSSLAAKASGVPSIAIGHGLVFATCHRIPGAPRGAWWRERAKAAIASVGATRYVAVNFAPVSPLDPSRTIVARPTLRAALGERPEPDATPEIVCYFRDDNGDHIAADLAAAGHRPVLFTKRRSVAIPGVRVVPQDRQAFARALLTATAVVSSAGSQLISECVAMGIPQFGLFEAGDDEQRLNVAMLRHFGQGDGDSFQRYCPKRLLDALPAANTASNDASGARLSRRSPGGSMMPNLDAVAAMRRTIASVASHPRTP